jgi:ubiquinone/menaquinone biosynthesis C-methylase UbiE
MTVTADSALTALFRCKDCGKPLAFSDKGVRACCDVAGGAAFRGDFLIYDPAMDKRPPPEMFVRDHDALNYVSHRKFPTQIDRLKNYLLARSAEDVCGTVLDLGCGPGPTTMLLLDAGYEVAAVDFSIQSLALNAQLCGRRTSRALFVQGNMNEMEFSEGAADGLMMADFLQHLGNKETQAAFLKKLFRALKPGGWFYLSFFNTNLLNRLQNDLEGARKNIPFRRLTLSEVRGMLPNDVKVVRQSVMNIFNGAVADRIATSLPLAELFAHMAVIEGVYRPQS